MTKNALLSTTLSLVALQFGSRLFSFGLNQLLLRSTTPAAFGVATIQFDTLRDTVLFLLREGIRGAVIRTRTGSTPSILQRQSRLLPVLLAPLVVPIFYSFYFVSSSSKTSSHNFTLILYALSTIIELLSEPSYLFTLSSWETLTSTRVRIEGFAVVTKALSTLIALNMVVDSSRALEAYGWGQVIYSSTLLLGLEYSVCSSNWKLIKQNGRGEGVGESGGGGSYFDSNLTKLGWALTKQSLVKQVLTEGDKFVVTRFGKSDQDLASYAVALNYGSLVARIIFQPIEESSRLYFSSFTTSSSSRLRSLDSISIHLSNVLTFYSHFTLILIFLVPPYISPLLNLLLGSTNWGGQDSNSSVSSTLKSYVYSLPFLAFNGVLEAGLQSFADQIWLKRYSRWMVICTIGFLGTFVWYNNHDADGSGSSDTSTASKGLILGNCVNMGMRIGFSSLFLFNYFVREFESVEKEELAKDKEGDIIDDDDEDDDEGDYERRKRMMKMFWQRLKFSNWRPSFLSFMGFFLGGQLCKYTEKRWLLSSSRGGRGKVLKSLGIHFGTGIIVGLGCLTITAISKRKELGILLKRYKDK